MTNKVRDYSSEKRSKLPSDDVASPNEEGLGDADGPVSGGLGDALFTAAKADD